MLQIKGMGRDGSYTLVLAHQDPGGQYNWLDTEGRETGIIFYRYMLNTAPLQQAKTRVVAFAVTMGPDPFVSQLVAQLPTLGGAWDGASCGCLSSCTRLRTNRLP